MADYKSRLLSREEVAVDTMAFAVQKPAGFKFRAGQFTNLTLPNPPYTDEAGNTRTFSSLSPPFANELVFATRMRGTAFKRSLMEMPRGSDVTIASAIGSFTLHEDFSKPAVFLAGGIGIKPFLSILRQADNDRLKQELYLFYSNRRPEDASYLQIFQTLAKTNRFSLTGTMTNMSAPRREWRGETCRIDRMLLSKYLPACTGRLTTSPGHPRSFRPCDRH